MCRAACRGLIGAACTIEAAVSSDIDGRPVQTNAPALQTAAGMLLRRTGLVECLRALAFMYLPWVYHYRLPDLGRAGDRRARPPLNK
jgi:hypothetical protein